MKTLISACIIILNCQNWRIFIYLLILTLKIKEKLDFRYVVLYFILKVKNMAQTLKTIMQFMQKLLRIIEWVRKFQKLLDKF